MRYNQIHSAFFLLLLLSFGISSRAQETLNANDPNTFILGGGQESNTAVLDLKRIAIVDLEPEDDILLSHGVGIEAGSPSGGTNIHDFWLNYTYRPLSGEKGKIYVRANQPIPNGTHIRVQIINTSSIGGSFNNIANTHIITLATHEQILINDFEGGYTGNGIGSGYEVRYTIHPDSRHLPPGLEILFELK